MSEQVLPRFETLLREWDTAGLKGSSSQMGRAQRALRAFLETASPRKELLSHILLSGNIDQINLLFEVHGSAFYAGLSHTIGLEASYRTEWILRPGATDVLILLHAQGFALTEVVPAILIQALMQDSFELLALARTISGKHAPVLDAVHPFVAIRSCGPHLAGIVDDEFSQADVEALSQRCSDPSRHSACSRKAIAYLALRNIDPARFSSQTSPQDADLLDFAASRHGRIKLRMRLPDPRAFLGLSPKDVASVTRLNQEGTCP